MKPTVREKICTEYSFDFNIVAVQELRRMLESTYEEISLLEGGDKTAVKERFDKISALQSKLKVCMHACYILL